MIINKKGILLTAFILIATTIFCFQETPEKKIIVENIPPIDSTLIHLKDDFKNFEIILKKGIDDCKCPGAAVVVIKDTSIVLMRGFGVKESKSADSVDTHTVFRLGSVSKGFASVVSAILANKGYFSWDDKLVKYLPEFELKSHEQTSRIEIKHILSHTTGLIRHAYTNLIETGWSKDDIIPLLKDVDLVGKEGENFAYQNVTYSLIEKVIESTVHKSYNEVLQQEIFQKCGMADASCSYQGILDTKDKAFPNKIISRNCDYAKTQITNKYYNAVAAGGVNASISDMANWIQLLMGNRPDIINDSTLDYIFKPVINTSNERRFYNHWEKNSTSYYALGWRVLNYKNRTIIYHGGYVNGYRSEIAFDRENKVAVCALFNASCEYSNQIVHDFFDFCDENFPNSVQNLMAGIVK